MMCLALNLKNLTSQLESLQPSVNQTFIEGCKDSASPLFCFIHFLHNTKEQIVSNCVRFQSVFYTFIGWFFFFYTHVLRAPCCHTAPLGVMTPTQWIERMKPEYNHYHEAHCLHSIVVQRKTLNCSKSKVLARHSDIYMLLCSQCVCSCVCVCTCAKTPGLFAWTHFFPLGMCARVCRCFCFVFLHAVFPADDDCVYASMNLSAMVCLAYQWHPGPEALWAF